MKIYCLLFCILLVGCNSGYNEPNVDDLFNNPESFQGRVELIAKVTNITEKCSFGGSGVGRCTNGVFLEGKDEDHHFSVNFLSCGPHSDECLTPHREMNQSLINKEILLIFDFDWKRLENFTYPINEAFIDYKIAE